MIGTKPEPGPRLIDGDYVNGIAGGANRSFVSDLTAHAGGTKAAGLQIPAGVALVQFDTVATNGDSALLPDAIPGTEVTVANSGAASLSLYGKGGDTINDAATANAYALATNVAASFFCVVAGQWKSLKSA